MGDRSVRRVAFLGVLIASLLVTLIGRLYYVQVLDRNPPTQAADGRVGAIVVPAVRGQIVDDRGRPLVTNTPTHVVTVDRETLLAQPDKGVAVLHALAGLLGQSEPTLAESITPCGVTVPDPCWTGEPYQPVPVDDDASTAVVLAISEHREDYPGVAVSTGSKASYPGGSLAAQVLGYTGAVDGSDEKADPSLNNADSIGRAGLEQQYDTVLRGVDGKQTLALTPAGRPISTVSTVAAKPGDTVVTSIDASVQALAEKALSDEIAKMRASGKPATSGALIVMDPNTGRIIAAASYPTYDPTVFVGGISTADYAKLTDPAANDPLVGRAIAGAYAPGSTFKLISASSDVTHNEITTTGKYPCPSQLTVDGRVKTNYDSEGYSYPLTLKQALDVSCDTFFYAPAVNEYYADESLLAADKPADEYLQATARAFGIGTRPGVDLPTGEQTTGSYADRETRLSDWTQNKAQYCANAASGYSSVADPTQRAYLTELAQENCTDGWRYRAGDNADMAIGQGETTVSPLQLAVAYSAMLNGGTVWNPTIGWAEVDAAGKVVKTISPTVKNKVPVAPSTLSFIANALQFTPDHTVSGALAFDGAPYKTQLGGKTGTAEVFGKQDTSWLASWGPVSKDAAGNPAAKFVVVGMVEQAGTGASAAAPMVRAVYNGLFGVGQPAALPSSVPVAQLPRISPVSVPRAPSVPSVPSAPAPTRVALGPSLDPLIATPAPRIGAAR
jgi:penicillin-binding protein 2